MSIKQFAMGGVAVAVLATSGFASAGDIEANVALSTDYVFRGFSQTDENPAISGGFDYGFDNGAYIGTWASNVDFDSETSAEIDFYAGYAFDISEGVNLDLTYVYYVYPDETDELNYSEFQSSIGFGDFSLGLIYSPDYFGSDDSAIVLNGDYSFGLSEGVSLDFHIGYTDVDADDFFALGEDSYVDYSVGISGGAAGVDLSLTLYGTDLDDIDAADDRVVFSIGKSF